MAAGRKKSKKRSGASSQSPPEPPPIFLDECIGGRETARQLRDRGLDIYTPDERHGIPHGLDDQEWARRVALKGWVAFTRDKSIRYRAAEKEAVARAGLALFTLTSRQNLSRNEIIDTIERASRRLGGFLSHNQPPFIAAVYRDGTIKLREKL